jgi:hypothetical protein
MPKKFPFCSLLIVGLSFLNNIHGQNSSPGKSNTRMSDSLVALYRSTMGQADRFYNGTEYMGYVMRPKGHPFFESNQMQLSEISVEGVIYSDSILYDLIDDAIILKDYSGAYNVRMVKEKIRSFKYMGHSFVRLGASADSTDEMPPGFYEQLYNGKTAVFVKHKKQLNTTALQGEVISEYVQYDTYFVRKENEYYRISNVKSLLDAFSEKRSEVRRFLREQHLDYKNDPRHTTRKAAEFFDQINK